MTQQPSHIQPSQSSDDPLLEIQNLTVSFQDSPGIELLAVDDVTMTIHAGKTLAVVGESGCGKSVTALSILRLIPSPPSRLIAGTILLHRDQGSPIDILSLNPKALQKIRGDEIAMIFQEPMTSLNPVMTIGDQVIEAIRLHRRVTRKQARTIAANALQEVGLKQAQRLLKSYPHEFSGGMRQRVMIAMALACQPRLLIADEPTTALDVTIQAQILDLIENLKETRSIGVMLITHDLGVVAQYADQVCVMYAGRVVEQASPLRIFNHPRHPYTKGLLACIPRIQKNRDTLQTITDLTLDQQAFAPIQTTLGPLRPWWPQHADTPDSRHRANHHPSLISAAPDHLVSCWLPDSASEQATKLLDAVTHTLPTG